MIILYTTRRVLFLFLSTSFAHKFLLGDFSQPPTSSSSLCNIRITSRLSTESPCLLRTDESLDVCDLIAQVTLIFKAKPGHALFVASKTVDVLVEQTGQQNRWVVGTDGGGYPETSACLVSIRPPVWYLDGRLSGI